MKTSTDKSASKKISSKFIYFFGSFGGILFGYDMHHRMVHCISLLCARSWA